MNRGYGIVSKNGGSVEGGCDYGSEGRCKEDTVYWQEITITVDR